MKHWSEFINTKSHHTQRLGKTINGLEFEKAEFQLKLKNTVENIESLETEIVSVLAPLYKTDSELDKAIFEAMEKAKKWNNEPIARHKPTHKKINNRNT